MPETSAKLKTRQELEQEWSLNRTFQPLTVLNSDTLKGNRVLEILFQYPWSALATHVIGMLQSLVSIILLFLSGLALRRRFQIN